MRSLHHKAGQTARAREPHVIASKHALLYQPDLYIDADPLGKHKTAEFDSFRSACSALCGQRLSVTHRASSDQTPVHGLGGVTPAARVAGPEHDRRRTRGMPAIDRAKSARASTRTQAPTTYAMQTTSEPRTDPPSRRPSTATAWVPCAPQVLGPRPERRKRAVPSAHAA